MDHPKHTLKLVLYAGLCNQLFMIFAALSYAIDNNFDIRIYATENRTLENNNKVYWTSILEYMRDKLLDKIDYSIPIYQEKQFDYVKIPPINCDFNIKGFFQSHKYFEHNYDKIIKLLKIDEKRDQIKDKYSYLFKKKTIAMHFRMGDYLSLLNHHPIATPEYYNNSLKYLETKLDIIKDNYDILYFCERHDKDLVNRYLEYIKKDRNYNFVKVSDDIEDWEQLLLMSCCDHFIIANSTFSWMAAYMSTNIEKITLYPSIWFGKALTHHNLKDLHPSSWIKIEV